MGLKCVLLQCVTCKLAEVSSQTNMVSLNTLSHFFFFFKEFYVLLGAPDGLFHKTILKGAGRIHSGKGQALLKNTWQVIG